MIPLENRAEIMAGWRGRVSHPDGRPFSGVVVSASEHGFVTCDPWGQIRLWRGYDVRGPCLDMEAPGVADHVLRCVVAKLQGATDHVAAGRWFRLWTQDWRWAAEWDAAGSTTFGSVTFASERFEDAVVVPGLAELAKLPRSRDADLLALRAVARHVFP